MSTFLEELSNFLSVASDSANKIMTSKMAHDEKIQAINVAADSAFATQQLNALNRDIANKKSTLINARKVQQQKLDDIEKQYNKIGATAKDYGTINKKDITDAGQEWIGGEINEITLDMFKGIEDLNTTNLTIDKLEADNKTNNMLIDNLINQINESKKVAKYAAEVQDVTGVAGLKDAEDFNAWLETEREDGRKNKDILSSLELLQFEAMADDIIKEDKLQRGDFVRDKEVYNKATGEPVFISKAELTQNTDKYTTKTPAKVPSEPQIKLSETVQTIKGLSNTFDQLVSPYSTDDDDIKPLRPKYDMSKLGGSDKQFDSRRLENILNTVTENIFDRLDKGLQEDASYLPFSYGANVKKNVLLGETFNQFKGRSLNEKVKFIEGILSKPEAITEENKYSTIFSADGDLNLSNFDDKYEGSPLPEELKVEMQMFKALTNYFGLDIKDVNQLPTAVMPK